MAQEADKPATEVPFLFNINEKAYALYEDRRWYPVVIRERIVDKHPENADAWSPTYFVHYNGWNERFNEWMVEDCLMKADTEGDRQAREENKKVDAQKEEKDKKTPKVKKGTKKAPRSRGKTLKINDDATPVAESRSESVVSEATSEVVEGKSSKRLKKDVSEPPATVSRAARTTAGGKKAKTYALTDKLGAASTSSSTQAINAAASSAGDSNTFSPFSTTTLTTAEEDDASTTASMVPPTTSGAGNSGIAAGGFKEELAGSVEGSGSVSGSIGPTSTTASARRGSDRRTAQHQQSGTAAEASGRLKSPPTTPLAAFPDVSLASPAISAASDVKTNEDSGSVNTAPSASGGPVLPATPLQKSGRRGGRVQQLLAASGSTTSATVAVLGGKSTNSSGSAASSISGTAAAVSSTVPKQQQQQSNRSVSQRRPSTATTPLTSPPVASPADASTTESFIDPANDAVRAEAQYYFELAAKSYLYPEPSENVWLVMNALPEIFNQQNAQRAQRYLTEWRVRRGAYLDALKDAKQYLLVVPESVQQMMLQDYMQIVYRQHAWSAKDSPYTMQAVLNSYKSYLDTSLDRTDAASVEWHELASSMILDIQQEAKSMCEALFSHRKVNNDTNDEQHSIFIMHEVFHMISAMRKKKPVFDLTDLGAPHLVRLLHQMVHYINLCTDVRGSDAGVNSGGRLADLQFAHLQAIMNFMGEEGADGARQVVSQKDKLYGERFKTGGDKTDVKVRELFYPADRLPVDAVYDTSHGVAHPPPKGVFFVESELSLDDVDESAQTRVETCFGMEAINGKMDDELNVGNSADGQRAKADDDASQMTAYKDVHTRTQAQPVNEAETEAQH